MLRDVKNETKFDVAIYEDLKNINAVLIHNQLDINASDQLIKTIGNRKKIIDLENFLSKKVALQESREGFLEVFIT